MQKERPFGWKTPKPNLSWGKLVLGHEEEEEGDLKSHKLFSYFLEFFYFSFSMVVFLPSMS